MYNLFFKILAITVVISTLCILGIKPKMHKKVLVYDSAYSIIYDSPNVKKDDILPKEETVKHIIEPPSKEIIREVQKNKIEPKQINTNKKNIDFQKHEIKRNVELQTKQVVGKNNVLPEKEPVKTEQVKINKQQVKIPTITQEQKQPEIKILTQQEEEVAWNIWRSNLQNQIMKDTKLPYIPKGIVFKFSFDVDKYGRLSNIKTWSLNSNYTPYAIQYIAPVIRSYQGKDILNFPDGTQRITTKFEGGLKISDNAKYSTPNDYNDIEKVKR